jgi:hypothetical protein
VSKRVSVPQKDVKLISSSISLWNTGKKKPIFTLPLAHGIVDLTEDSEIKGARWITSLAALRGTDLFASGKLEIENADRHWMRC